MRLPCCEVITPQGVIQKDAEPQLHEPSASGVVTSHGVAGCPKRTQP